MTATWAEWHGQLTNEIKLGEILRQAASTVTDDLVAQIDTIIQALEGGSRDMVDLLAGINTFREGVNAALVDGMTQILSARVRAVKPVISAPEDDIDDIIDRISDYMDTNSESVNSRNFTRGSWSAGGGNTGDGEVIRITTDSDGYAIENSFAQVITGTCVSNAMTGTTPGNEVFEFIGQEAADDALELEVSGFGSGEVQELIGRRSGDSLVNNPSFNGFSGTIAVPTDITDWTVTNDVGNLQIDQTNYFVEDDSEAGTPSSLQFDATETISQKLSVSGNSLEPDRPVLTQIAWNRTVGSASGTLALHQGSVSTSVAVSAQSGWQTLRYTLGANSWPVNFDEDELTDIQVVWTRTGGTLLVDDLRFIQFGDDDEIDGVPTMLLGGATRWRLDDTGTITDTEGGATVQRWFWRIFNRYLPSDNGGTETITDPSVSF